MNDHDLVRAAALAYFEGWYDADPERMDAALHPELVKRWSGDCDGLRLGPILDKPTMVAKTADGGGRDLRPTTSDPFDVQVLDVYGDIATVVVRSPEYREYLHLVRAPVGWQIVNAFFRMTEGVEP
jgi:hypothetical protein